MANSKDTTIKTYEFKLRVNKSFVEASERELEHSRQIYNAALAERISCYQITGASFGYKEQSRHLTEARTLPDVKSHLRTIQQDAVERVEEAFKGFFRRVKSGEKPGFPRFKGQDRYHTFSQKYEKVRLAIRVYECAKCGFVIGRDHNPAIIIDRAGQSPNKRPWRRDSASEKREREGRTQSEPQRGID